MDHQFNNPVILIFRNYLMREIKFVTESLKDVSVLETRRFQYHLNLTAFLLQNPSLISSSSYGTFFIAIPICILYFMFI
jgi:hypothetical protein